MAFRAMAKLATTGAKQISRSQLINYEAAVSASCASVLQQTQLVHTSRYQLLVLRSMSAAFTTVMVYRHIFQDAMENAMKESPDGTKWKDNAVLYDYTKESKPVSPRGLCRWGSITPLFWSACMLPNYLYYQQVALSIAGNVSHSNPCFWR